MPNKLPKFFDKHKICIICEGNEEYEYLKRLKDLNVWNEQYEVSLVNAGGNGNIPARYQDRYQNGADELVLVFCDTEKKPHEQYEDIKRKINVFHGVDNAADEVIMFGNPCTMQIISKHWTDENLKSPAKPVNVPLIKKYTGVENYKGRADQINEVMKYVTVENYKDMSRRVKDLDSDDSVTGSSNFGKFIKLFESDDSGWIEEINKVITYDDISEFKWHGTAYLLQNTLSKYINSADYMGDMYFLDIPKKAFRFVCNERQFSGRGNLLIGEAKLFLLDIFPIIKVQDTLNMKTKSIIPILTA